MGEVFPDESGIADVTLGATSSFETILILKKLIYTMALNLFMKAETGWIRL